MEGLVSENQAGFRRGRGTRDHIANLRWIMETSREYQKKLYMCFIDYSKAFDCVDHHILWRVLEEMGIPVHIIMLLKTLYENQEATVRTEFGDTVWFVIMKGVRQGCILSPYLFNLYSEYIMRKVGIDEDDGGIRMGGGKHNNLRYADDTTLMAESANNLKRILKKVKEQSAALGLHLNLTKTKIMTTEELREFKLG